MKHTIKTKAAVKTHIPGLTAGTTEQKETVIFLSEDYDNHGNVSGYYKRIDTTTKALYQISYTYSDESLKKLGWNRQEVNSNIERARKLKIVLEELKTLRQLEAA